MALKSRSNILDLVRVKLSWGIFFFLSCLMKSFFHQHSGFSFIFVKNARHKAANFTFALILPEVDNLLLSGEEYLLLLRGVLDKFTTWDDLGFLGKTWDFS